MRTPVTAAVFYGPHRPPEIETLYLDPPGPGEVAIRMTAAGVCGSDLHIVNGEWARPTNIVLGHEGAGLIEALGPGVDERPAGVPVGAGGWTVGDLVALPWNGSCRRCPACRRGEVWLCARPVGTSDNRLGPGKARLHRSDGTPVGVYCGVGTFSDRQVVAIEAAVTIPPETPAEIAALISCGVATGVGAVRNTAGVRPGESVVVVGPGGVGLSIVMGASLAGAYPIIAIGRSQERLTRAIKAGATHTLLSAPDEASELGALGFGQLRDAVRSLTGGGADHGFEAVGLPSTANLALEVVRPGGILTLVGMTPQGRHLEVDVYDFIGSGKQIRACNSGSADPVTEFPRLAQLYLAGKLPLDLLITDRIGLPRLNDAFEKMRRGTGARYVVVYAT